MRARSVDEDRDESRVIATLGASVRATRKRLGLSVKSLAERAGVSFGLLSQLERGLGNPSLQSLQRLAGAMGLSASQLLDEPAEAISVVRADRRLVLPRLPDADSSPQAVRELMTPRGESSLQLIRSTLPRAFSNENRPFRHLGVECVTVERGALVVVHGKTRIELAMGDTATYVCSVPHWWENDYADETVVLGAVTPFER